MSFTDLANLSSSSEWFLQVPVSDSLLDFAEAIFLLGIEPSIKTLAIKRSTELTDHFHRTTDSTSVRIRTPSNSFGGCLLSQENHS
jgi:hypothetical protein